MSGLRFSSFGAATVPLSKIIVDKDLDLRPYGVLARYCKAPVNPTVWPTEELEWGDGEPVTSVGAENIETYSANNYKYTPLLTADAPCEIIVRLVDVAEYDALKPPVITLADEVTVRTGPVLYPGDSYTFEPVILNTGDVLKIGICRLSATGGYGVGIISRVELINTGRVVGDTTLNLSGKWLALGIDMKGFDATVKIQGVEMPYEDYLKYFPIAPTELKISGSWSPLQERPIIEVYK